MNRNQFPVESELADKGPWRVSFGKQKAVTLRRERMLSSPPRTPDGRIQEFAGDRTADHSGSDGRTVLSDIVIAVAEAGGLGSLPCAMLKLALSNCGPSAA
jgi:hypothetical protein